MTDGVDAAAETEADAAVSVSGQHLVPVHAPRGSKVPASKTPADLVTVADLEADPHPVLARLRAAAPVTWVPVLGAWLVTGYDLAVEVMRDARTFTVDDPRFSTAKVVGPSMLSLDGAQHARHRGPFNRVFRHDEVHARLASFIRTETGRLVSAIEPRGAAELRRAVAGPLAVVVMAEALGLGRADPIRVLAWYDGIVAAVQAEAAAVQAAGPGGPAAFAELAASLREVIAAPGSASVLSDAAGPLTEAEVISNAAVMMFGGIETTEGMIANALLHLLSSPAQLELVLADRGLVPAAIEESLRLEPAAAVVDRFATRDAWLGGASVRAGDQVTVSIAGANRDPAVFGEPDVFDVRRPNAARHLAFAHGPHFCLGAHLARLEAQVAIGILLGRLPRLRLDLRYPSAPRGLVFRKPPDLRVRWNRSTLLAARNSQDPADLAIDARGLRSQVESMRPRPGNLDHTANTGGGAMSEQDDFAERFHRDRHEHAGASQRLDDDQLARLTEEERVAAGLDAYDPDEVPSATDTPPQPEDITLNEDWQEERAEFRREEDKGELRPVDERHPFPPTRYE